MTDTSKTQQNLVFLTARVSFPNIVDPQTTTNDKGETKHSYNCDLIMAPNDPGFQKFMQTYAAMAQEKWKEHAPQAMQMIQADRKARCYGSGEEKVSKKTFQIHQGYAGNVFISARSERQPQIIAASDGKQVDPTNTMQIRAEASRIEGGIIANVVVRPWLQQNTHGSGVRCDLIAIQFAKDDGTRFAGGAPDVTNMFGAVAGAAPAAPVGFAPVAMPAAPFAAAPQPQMTVPGGYPPAPLGMPSFMQG